MIKTTTDISSYLKNSWLLMVLVFLLCYFSYHIISGDRGIVKMLDLKKQIKISEKILDEKQYARQDLEDKVKRLSSSSLDLDLLDERARTVLNFAKYDEFVILDK